jgi:hypothetical protein
VQHSDQFFEFRTTDNGDVDIGYAITVFECRGDVFHATLMNSPQLVWEIYDDREGWPDME